MTERRLELDFVAPRRRPRWLGYGLLAAALLVAGNLVVRYHAARVEIERASTTHGLLGAERGAPAALPKERLDEQVRSAQGVVRQLALPWAAMIHALEEVANPDVAILQLQPDAQQRIVRVTAEARHEAAMLDYLRSLAAGKALSNAHLLNHQVQLEDPQRPIQFAVQATFAPAP